MHVGTHDKVRYIEYYVAMCQEPASCMQQEFDISETENDLVRKKFHFHENSKNFH